MSVSQREESSQHPTATEDIGKDDVELEEENVEEPEREDEDEDASELPIDSKPIQTMHRLKYNPLQPKKAVPRNPFSSPTDSMLSPATQKLAQKRTKLQQKIQPKFLASKLRAAAKEEKVEAKGATIE